MNNSLHASLLSGDRSALARGITLAESTRTDHEQETQALLNSVMPQTGKSIRIGITGVPGVGKSTFIEQFGLHVIGQGHKVAVLAVDPSSAKSGGSILGDKTRMHQLSMHEKAYIRPSPTGGSLGGVARRTREAMLLCEAAGYDVILVETVGVGQSETEVADMVDMFVLMLLPGSGDELQGIKRGIMELADLVVVNKADGDLLPQAKRVASDYTAALRLMTPHGAPWQPKVELVSALENKNISGVWDAVKAFQDTTQKAGVFSTRRSKQAVAWMWKEMHERLRSAMLHDPKVAALLPQLEAEVAAEKRSPTAAAQMLLEAFK